MIRPGRILGSLGPVAVGALVLGAAWFWLRPVPDPAAVFELAQAGRLDEAAEAARARVRFDPGDAGARLLLAQILVDAGAPDDLPGGELGPADEPKLREAIDVLRGARFADRSAAALARLAAGKASYHLLRYADAEAAWLDALGLDPTVPEAGWGLLDLYYVEGRTREARALALRLFDAEPDPRDRVQLLLELIRQEDRVAAPGSVVGYLSPVVKRGPGEVRAVLALGLAEIRDAAVDRGVERLRGAVEHYPDDPETWEALLRGLDEGSLGEDLVEACGRLPMGWAEDPRFGEFLGRAAQVRGDWPAAADAYRRALEADPHERRIEYRLARVLRLRGDEAGAEALDDCHKAHFEALREARELYLEASAIADLGTTHRPELYARMAANRDRLGRPGEADAWRSLISGPKARPAR